MITQTVPSVSPRNYPLNLIQDEVRQLVERGVISRQQHIYTLCEYIPAREWVCVEEELERFEYLLRDRVADLIGPESWEND